MRIVAVTGALAVVALFGPNSTAHAGLNPVTQARTIAADAIDVAPASKAAAGFGAFSETISVSNAVNFATGNASQNSTVMADFIEGKLSAEASAFLPAFAHGTSLLDVVFSVDSSGLYDIHAEAPPIEIFQVAQLTLSRDGTALLDYSPSMPPVNRWMELAAGQYHLVVDVEAAALGRVSLGRAELAFSIRPVPEPSAWLLGALAASAFCVVSRRRCDE